MHKNKFQNDIARYKERNGAGKNTPHTVFVEKLRKQVFRDSDAEEATDDECSEEITKELKVKFDALFANLDDDE